VKLFNEKCYEIIFGEKLFNLNNLFQIILVGATLAWGPRQPPTGPADKGGTLVESARASPGARGGGGGGGGVHLGLLVPLQLDI